MMQYGSQATASWGFETLDNLDDTEQQPAEADDDATDSLLHHIGSLGAPEPDPDADVDSTFAEGDMDFADRMAEDFGGEEDDFAGPGGFLQGSDGRAGTPIDSIEPGGYDYQEDDHGAYSSVHRPYYDADSFHLEDAGAVGGEEGVSPPADEVRLSDDEVMAGAGHGKME
ncbi:hypothetical protein B0A55_13814 [Friedmanniomyces simplex]|uniref:Uncharacterized protein n=1 Tax=Friedmanniomyces simplex TaxID=329884 RepID=A0A4U0VBJ8_9PEZI|nr:hypothetical protein B0A55_13814 [Friedmanniomyces simplex]